jgi:hypothetical protein
MRLEQKELGADEITGNTLKNESTSGGRVIILLEVLLLLFSRELLSIVVILTHDAKILLPVG